MFAIEYNQKLNFLVQFDIENQFVLSFSNQVKKTFDHFLPTFEVGVNKIDINTTQYKDWVRLDIKVTVENCSDVVRQVKNICQLEKYKLV